MAADGEVLERFGEATRAWFTSAFVAPTGAQAGAWSAISAGQHALVLIYPNPLNPRRYVVLNSGFTFREYDYLNNARQVPKLPDWAVIDVRTPPGPRRPGAVVAADFFGEDWGLRPRRPD